MELAYYLRKLYPDMEIFGGMGSNLTTGTKVNAWAVTPMTEMMGSNRVDSELDSENTFRHARGWPAGRPYVSVSKGNELLPEVKEAIAVIAKTRTRDSNGELILATGHNSPEEVLMMIREAKRESVLDDVGRRGHVGGSKADPTLEWTVRVHFRSHP